MVSLNDPPPLHETRKSGRTEKIKCSEGIAREVRKNYKERPPSLQTFQKMDMKRIEEMFGSIEENMTQINRKLDNVITEMNQLRNDNIKLKDQASKQENRIEKLERELERRLFVEEGINPKDIHQQIIVVYSTIFQGLSSFVGGRESIEDDPRSGRPSDVTPPKLKPWFSNIVSDYRC
ncbi:hypothetical protein ILUMI_24748 [Ignelater luminosus]|uniref:Uncharacterized protein n=1 Tax=Ignelater luminosus TaxID=2038154 RepID=A0A8K0C9X1_IGNLU|nr:hypothetical protein ILUMI_24748 [Ignelater luminosus]